MRLMTWRALSISPYQLLSFTFSIVVFATSPSLTAAIRNTPQNMYAFKQGPVYYTVDEVASTGTLCGGVDGVASTGTLCGG